jgi:hypothetical protein
MGSPAAREARRGAASPQHILPAVSAFDLLCVANRRTCEPNVRVGLTIAALAAPRSFLA